MDKRIEHQDSTPVGYEAAVAARTEFTKTILRMAFVLMVACLAVAAYLSSAWFVNNSQVSVQGENVAAKTVALYVEHCWTMNYGMTETEDSTVQTEYFQCIPEVETQTVTMLPYDAIFNRNDNTPAVLCLEVKGDDINKGSPFQVTLSSKTTGTWTENSWKVTNDYKVPLSCVLEAQCLVAGDGTANPLEAVTEVVTVDTEDGTIMDLTQKNTATAQTVMALWENVSQEKFSEKATVTPAAAQTFLTYDKADGETVVKDVEKAETLTFTISDYQDLVLETDTGPALYVYLVLDYNRDLVHVYTDENSLTARVGQSVDEHVFPTDLTTIDVIRVTTDTPSDP
jgi:hypothetical protein